jgi:hypothetical protein
VWNLHTQKNGIGPDINLKSRKGNMNFIRLIGRFPNTKTKPTVVTFTGGMGAQIISAAIYFLIKNTGQAVYADLSYFDKPATVAIAGNAGDCSHWSWQLGHFGLLPEAFQTSDKLDKRNSNILNDGPQKLELGLKALSQSEIKNLFKIPDGSNDLPMGEGGTGDFLCMHVRRGDYVNVASHLIADSEFLNVIRKFSGFVNKAVVLSDSPIESDFKSEVTSYFPVVHFLDNTDAFIAHRIMRTARILICSNSQFSLTAAVLNQNALVVIPKQWFGSNDRSIEAPIHACSKFQIMDNSAVQTGV